VPLRGADRVAVDALGADALAAPALDVVVEAQQHRPLQHEGLQQQPEQHPCRRPAAPGGAVQHAVVVDEPPLPAEPADAQDAGHRALTGHQDGAEQQHLGVPPGVLAKERREA
jgi:hypothetical protein